MRLRHLPLKGAEPGRQVSCGHLAPGEESGRKALRGLQGTLAARPSRLRGGRLVTVTSMSMDDFSFAPPPFKPDEGLASLTRSLRELGLTARGSLFERRGTAIARAAVADDTLAAARVKRPSRSSPEWQSRSLRSSADVRDFVADLKKQLAQWSDRDD